MQENGLTVFVTGASGFIGGDIVRFLAATNPNWVILANGRSALNQPFESPNVRYIQGALEDFQERFQADIAVHCAGLADDRSEASELLKHNVQATSHLLDCLQGCRCFIFISSSSVYDFSDGLPKSESDLPLDMSCISAYGRSKRAAEQLLEASGLPSVYILRPRAVYGLNDRVLQPRILRLLKGRRLFLPGQLAIRSSLTHIENLISAVVLSIGQCAPGVHIYNVADQETYILRHVFGAIARRKLNASPKIVVLPMRLLKAAAFFGALLGLKMPFSRQSLNYLSQHSVLNTGKIRQDLGYKGYNSFEF